MSAWSDPACGVDEYLRQRPALVRGRTTAPEGLVLGHEITGEVVEVGPDVESSPPTTTGASPPEMARVAASTSPAPATVLNSLMELTHAGGAIGIPGLYVTGDPGGVDDLAKRGSLSLSLGTGWAKSSSFSTGQCPIMRYHRPLKAVLADKVTNTKT